MFWPARSPSIAPAQGTCGDRPDDDLRADNQDRTVRMCGRVRPFPCDVPDDRPVQTAVPGPLDSGCAPPTQDAHAPGVLRWRRGRDDCASGVHSSIPAGRPNRYRESGTSVVVAAASSTPATTSGTVTTRNTASSPRSAARRRSVATTAGAACAQSRAPRRLRSTRHHRPAAVCWPRRCQRVPHRWLRRRRSRCCRPSR